MYRLLAGQPSVCLNSLICSSIRFSAWERLVELCAISACEYLSCQIKTIFTKYEWSAVFRKIQSKFYTVFLTYTIGRIIIQSEFRYIFRLSNYSCHGNTAAPKIAPERITRNYQLSKYCNKIELNFTFVILYNVLIQLCTEHIINIFCMKFKHFYW